MFWMGAYTVHYLGKCPKHYAEGCINHRCINSYTCFKASYDRTYVHYKIAYSAVHLILAWFRVKLSSKIPAMKILKVSPNRIIMHAVLINTYTSLIKKANENKTYLFIGEPAL